MNHGQSARTERCLPRAVGLCPDPSHVGEFYMPDPKPGDTCPSCSNVLVIYVPLKLTQDQQRDCLDGDDHDHREQPAR